ncbi:MAG: protoporphyrinogen/coproporphyrinogen oxidase [Deltaproteobacteria bacterium]
MGYNARFWYPKRGGIEQLAMSFINDIEHVHLNSEITAIDIANREITIASAAKERFDCLISTLPLPELPNLVKGLPQEVAEAFKKLRWNSIFNLNLGVNASDKSGKHWIYFPEKEIIFFRAGFYNNFSSDIAPRNATSLYAEVSYPKDKMINTKDITAQIKENLKKAGILNRRSEIVLEDANDIKYGYPICDINYNSARAEIIRYLSGNGIFTCGRYGSWRYMSMEDVILDGKIVADKLSKKNELGGKI